MARRFLRDGRLLQGCIQFCRMGYLAGVYSGSVVGVRGGEYSARDGGEEWMCDGQGREGEVVGGCSKGRSMGSGGGRNIVHRSNLMVYDVLFVLYDYVCFKVFQISTGRVSRREASSTVRVYCADELVRPNSDL